MYSNQMPATCPNGDPGFNRILEAIFGSSDPALRKQVFYTVCIFFRFSLYSLVWLLRDHIWMQVAVGLFSLFAVINLTTSISVPGHQWWSKRFQLIMSVLIAAACGATLAGYVDSITIPVLLFTSLAGGVAQSLLVKFC
jgi:hypothetical protein